MSTHHDCKAIYYSTCLLYSSVFSLLVINAHHRPYDIFSYIFSIHSLYFSKLVYVIICVFFMIFNAPYLTLSTSTRLSSQSPPSTSLVRDARYSICKKRIEMDRRTRPRSQPQKLYHSVERGERSSFSTRKRRADSIPSRVGIFWRFGDSV